MKKLLPPAWEGGGLCFRLSGAAWRRKRLGLGERAVVPARLAAAQERGGRRSRTRGRCAACEWVSANRKLALLQAEAKRFS
jgi:hypothetical protein